MSVTYSDCILYMSSYLPALKEGLAWLKLKPGPVEPNRPVAVLGVAVAVAPNRPPVLEGPFLPAW